VLHSRNDKGDGDYNYGRFSNPKLDALTAKIKVEMNREARLAMIREALAAQKTEFNHIPLHRQVIPWAARAGVDVPHRADNWVMPVWVTMP
jgi:peptide/nickel transport system substrate-binding protein